eukprot:1433139-Rhodomonas_salina.1
MDGLVFDVENMSARPRAAGIKSAQPLQMSNGGFPASAGTAHLTVSSTWRDGNRNQIGILPRRLSFLQCRQAGDANTASKGAGRYYKWKRQHA